MDRPWLPPNEIQELALSFQHQLSSRWLSLFFCLGHTLIHIRALSCPLGVYFCCTFILHRLSPHLLLGYRPTSYYSADSLGPGSHHLLDRPLHKSSSASLLLPDQQQPWPPEDGNSYLHWLCCQLDLHNHESGGSKYTEWRACVALSYALQHGW